MRAISAGHGMASGNCRRITLQELCAKTDTTTKEKVEIVRYPKNLTDEQQKKRLQKNERARLKRLGVSLEAIKKVGK